MAAVNLITIDPGNTTGWAAFSDGVLVHAGVDKKADLFGGQGTLLGCRSPAPTTILIELPRWYPRDQVDTNDLIDLAVLVGEAKRFYEVQGCRVELVSPRTWKGTVPKKIHNQRVLGCLTPEEVAVMPRRPRAKDHDNNMVDAVGMGLWKLGRLR